MCETIILVHPRQLVATDAYGKLCCDENKQ